MSNLYESVVGSEGIADLKEKILGELKDKELNQEAVINALTASTSMGFNTLFEVLSKMTANAHILDTAIKDLDEDVENDELLQVAQDIVDLVFVF